MDKIIIYTDGSCRVKLKAGGWGVVMTCGSISKELYGSVRDTTNNRMELTAAIKGLEALRRPCTVTLVTDSQYVIKGITQWVNKWANNKWCTASGKDVKNKDLWIDLHKVNCMHNVTWEWVKGHSGHPMNELADSLATTGSGELI